MKGHSVCFMFANSQRITYLVLSVFAFVIAAFLNLMPATSSSASESELNAPIHVVGRIRLGIPNNKIEEYETKTAALFEATVDQERPNLYTCSRDINDPELYTWNEIWPSLESFESHLESLHFNTWYQYIQEYQIGDLDVIYAPQSAFKEIQSSASKLAETRKSK